MPRRQTDTERCRQVLEYQQAHPEIDWDTHVHLWGVVGDMRDPESEWVVSGAQPREELAQLYDVLGLPEQADDIRGAYPCKSRECEIHANT
jgi:hypothetical protein